jgi:hypothetical protein
VIIITKLALEIKKDKGLLQAGRCFEALAHFVATTALSKKTAEVDPDR